MQSPRQSVRLPSKHQQWPYPHPSLLPVWATESSLVVNQCHSWSFHPPLTVPFTVLLHYILFMGQNEHQSAVQLDQDSPMQDAYELPVESSLLKTSNISAGTGDQNEKISDEPREEEEKSICRICHCSSEDLENGSQADCPVSVAKESIHGSSSKTTDHFKIDIEDPFFLITPCFCTGSLQYVHHSCLQHWIRSSNRSYCELCKYSFKMKKKSKPIYKVSL